jgi:hypothetical protein
MAREFGQYGGHKLTVVSAHRAENPPRMVLDGFATTRDGDNMVARGTLCNTGSVPCYSVKAVLFGYDPAGILLRTEGETPEAAFQKMLAPASPWPSRPARRPTTPVR